LTKFIGVLFLDRFLAQLYVFVCRKPKYLKVSRKLLIRTLRLKLQHRLVTQTEQNFAVSRLKVLDRQICIYLYRQMWQSYFDLGSKHQIWPVRDEMQYIVHEIDYCFKSRNK